MSCMMVQEGNLFIHYTIYTLTEIYERLLLENPRLYFFLSDIIAGPQKPWNFVCILIGQ